MQAIISARAYITVFNKSWKITNQLVKPLQVQVQQSLNIPRLSPPPLLPH